MLTSAIIAAVLASTQISVGVFEHLPRQTQDVYVLGLIEGWGWANAANDHAGQPPLYCPPPELSITTDQAIAIGQDFIEDPNRVVGRDDPYGMVLLMAMQHVFRCPSVADAPTATY